MSFFENTRKPEGFGGKIMVAMMNLGHSPVARWGLRFLELVPDAKVLDCGCGGGSNIKRLLKKCPEGIVKGIDYSPVSVEKTKKVNELSLIHISLKHVNLNRGLIVGSSRENLTLLCGDCGISLDNLGGNAAHSLDTE